MGPEIDKITRIQLIEIKIGESYEVLLQKDANGSFRVTMRDFVMVS